MSIGNSTAKIVEAFLSSGSEPKQGYKACASLTKLGDRYGHNRLKNACSKVWKLTSMPSIRIISSMLKNGQDKLRDIILRYNLMFECDFTFCLTFHLKANYYYRMS